MFCSCCYGDHKCIVFLRYNLHGSVNKSSFVGCQAFIYNNVDLALSQYDVNTFNGNLFTLHSSTVISHHLSLSLMGERLNSDRCIYICVCVMYMLNPYCGFFLYIVSNSALRMIDKWQLLHCIDWQWMTYSIIRIKLRHSEILTH